MLRTHARERSIFGLKTLDLCQLLIISNALNRSNNKDFSLCAQLVLSYHLFEVPWVPALILPPVRQTRIAQILRYKLPFNLFSFSQRLQILGKK